MEAKRTLEFKTTVKVEKYASEEARRRGDQPEVVERTRTMRITPAQALALGFTPKDIEEARHGTHPQSG